MRISQTDKIAIILSIIGICYSVVKFNINENANITYLILSIPIYYTLWVLIKRKAYLCFTFLLINTIMLIFIITLSMVNINEINFNSVLRVSAYKEHIVLKAIFILYLFNIIMANQMLLFAPKNWDISSPSISEFSLVKTFFLPTIFVALILHMLTIRGPLITEASYYSAQYIRLGAGEHDRTLQLLGCFLMIFSLSSSVIFLGWKNHLTKIAVFIAIFIIIYFYLLRGSRGVVFGFGLLLGFLILLKTKEKKKYLKVIFGFFVLFYLLQIWASVRTEAINKGLLNAIVDNIFFFKEKIVNEHDIMKIQRFPQLSWNLFDIIHLYDSGISRDGETYINLIPQAIPKPIAETIGFKRPLADPWILAMYVPHGGAINPVAEAYWNFGMYGIICISLIMGSLLIWLENLFRRLPLIFIFIYFGCILLFPGSYIGGTQAFVRAIEATLLMILALKLILNNTVKTNKPLQLSYIPKI